MVFRAFGVAIAVAIGLAASSALAQQPPQSLRGQIIDVTDLTVVSRIGVKTAVKLTEQTGVFLVSEGTHDDIQAGKFVGVTSIERRGLNIALEVHIFAEALRGLGEGHNPWDLVPEKNMMTNANIADVVARGNRNELTLRYVVGEEKTPGEQTIYLPDTTPVAHFNPGARENIIRGEWAFIFGSVGEDGSYTAFAVAVGEDGYVPPL